jgi:Bacterial archaeo-eukaryotic release factor family 2
VNARFLRRLYAYPGPWASVYLDTSTDTFDAPQQIELAWRAADDELAAAGADQATRAALAVAVRDHTGTGRHGLALFATAGRVVLARALPHPPALPRVTWGPLPSVLPLLSALGEQAHWLRVLVDRTGGEVLDAGGVPRTVRGSQHYPMTKAAPGGWSQPRYQRAAENSWLHNAKEVAEEVSRTVAETGADVVVLAGEVRERQLLVEHLPPAVAERVVQTDAGSRAAGSDLEPLDEVTERAVRSVVERRYTQVLDDYRAGRAHGLAVAGRSAVRTPLEWGQVKTLLLSPDLPAEAADGLVRDAVTEDADVVLVDPDQEPLPEGVGAVLRFQTPTG